jgi:hypothetical protein
MIVRRAVVAGRDPAQVAAGLRDQLRDVMPAPSLVVAFASWQIDPDAMAAALAETFAPAPVIG